MALPSDIQTLLDALEPEIRRAFVEAIQAITSQAQLATVEGHLRDGNIEAAIAALKLDPLFFRPLDRAINEAYYRGGVAALAALPAIPDPFGVAGRFLASMEDMTAPFNGESSTSED